MYYYHLIISIYEPLLDKCSEVRPTIKRIIYDARRYLETPVRIYYLRHGFEALDLFIVMPLMLTGFRCVDAIRQGAFQQELETLRSARILVAQGLHRQRRNHYLVSALFKILHERMNPTEITILKNTISLNDLEEYESQVKGMMVQ